MNYPPLHHLHPRGMLVMISEAQSLTPGGPDPIHNLNPLTVNDFIVKRRTPGGLDPIHNPSPPPVNDFIVYQLSNYQNIHHRPAISCTIHINQLIINL
ncbi:hypothetical protein V6N13_099291 [Hibiscus sabdariffa]|uniref:Uncharacterized protein n=1 Tax=Hibiscus sabdariffa TaxID=183260 RepID=A0ABR2PZW4_9ROSI